MLGFFRDYVGDGTHLISPKKITINSVDGKKIWDYIYVPYIPHFPYVGTYHLIFFGNIPFHPISSHIFSHIFHIIHMISHMGKKISPFWSYVDLNTEAVALASAFIGELQRPSQVGHGRHCSQIPRFVDGYLGRNGDIDVKKNTMCWGSSHYITASWLILETDRWISHFEVLIWLLNNA